MLSAHEGSLPIRRKGINMKQNKLTPKKERNLVDSCWSCIRRTQNIETELYKPQPMGFSVPSATMTTSPVCGGGFPMILSTAPLYTIGLPSLKSCVFPFLRTTFATPDETERGGREQEDKQTIREDAERRWLWSTPTATTIAIFLLARWWWIWLWLFFTNLPHNPLVGSYWAGFIYN